MNLVKLNVNLLFISLLIFMVISSSFSISLPEKYVINYNFWIFVKLLNLDQNFFFRTEQLVAKREKKDM